MGGARPLMPKSRADAARNALDMERDVRNRIEAQVAPLRDQVEILQRQKADLQRQLEAERSASKLLNRLITDMAQLLVLRGDAP